MQRIPVELPWPGWRAESAGSHSADRRAMGFREFVIKIHGHCNLACDYCYVYEMADQSWRDKPRAMSRTVFAETCRMIRDHLLGAETRTAALVFHGGEPLLVGSADLEYFASTARAVLEPVAGVGLGIQTNGVLLDEDVLGVCDRWNIRVGVSIDGGAEEHDRHRLDRRGRGSYARVAAGLHRLTLPRWRHLYSGLLCTVDVANDPVRTYEALLEFAPPIVDFLLPHGNWMSPPPHRPTDHTVTPYADWLLAIFDRWYGAPEPETRVRLFEDIIALLLGGRAASEAVGLAPVRLAVVETDGSLEQVDELKSAFPGAPRIMVQGNGNRLDLAAADPSVLARQIGAAALSDTCLSCPIHQVCGGGHYVHRYRSDTGFRNPSVYCPDLLKLITHIESRVRADIDAARR